MSVPEAEDPLINTVLGGARIQRRVSAGLLANVYLGHYERLNVPVAVKVLSPKATSQGMNKERFVREGRALAQLSHQNIIKIYNVGHENGRYFIVMDWIQDGMNLRQLAQSRPLTPIQSLKVASRLAEALEYIHSKQLIHRDIKPANVCLRKGGVPVLMDFSLIKDQSSDVQLTAPGTIMGTVNFMPPEQAQPGGPFGNVGPWSDVYSVGGTLYWLLTGRPPFKGRTPMETIIKLIREPHVPPSQYNPTIPPEVDALIAKCFTKKADDRYQSAREFIQAVDDLVKNCAEALQRGAPPPLAADDDAGGGSPAAPAGSAMLPTGAVAQAKAWGGASSGSGAARASSGVQPAIPQGDSAALRAPLNPAQAAVPSASGSNRVPQQAAPQMPQPAPPRQTGRMAPGAQPQGAPQPGMNPHGAMAAGQAPAPRATGRLGSSSGEARLAQMAANLPGGPGSPIGAPPILRGPGAPPNGSDNAMNAAMNNAIENEQTVRLAKGPAAPPEGARGSGLHPPQGQPPAPQQPAAVRTSGERNLPKPANAGLSRSWVEDAPSKPSWTNDQTGSNTNLPPAAPGSGSADADPPAPPAPAPPERPAPRPLDAAQKTPSDQRLMKAPVLPPRGRSASMAQIVLIVGAVVIIILCLVVAVFVLFFRGNA
jgi:tRNA A-37 threonylcarbamoyl transferase component Bud32